MQYPRPARSGISLLVPAAGLTLALAACGGGGGDSASSAPTTSSASTVVSSLVEVAAQRPATWSRWTRGLLPAVPTQYPVAGDPSVVRDATGWRMAYTCYDPGIQRPETCMAQSSDGVTWRHANTDEALVLGRTLRSVAGSWHDTHETPFLLSWRGGHHLYVSGYADTGGGSMASFPAWLGLATSTDGLRFGAVESEPVLKGTPRGRDADAIFSPSIVEHEGVLYMVYAGHCWTACDHKPGVYLLGATSTDGRRWTKRPGHLFEGASLPPFFKDYAAEPELVKGPDGAFYLFYTAVQGDDPHMIGIARSTSPFGPWEFMPQPAITTAGAVPNDAEVVAPSVVIEGGKVRMWFSGFRKAGGPAIAMYYAEAAWPLVTR